MSEQPKNVGTSLEMAATPARIWDVLSDLARMPEFSPELRRAYVIGKPGIGATIIGINRRKAVLWPTTSKVVRWEPERAVAWRTRESGATWVYELEPTATGTKVTGRRVLSAYTIPSRLMVPFLGGAAGHDDELNSGIAATLAKIKAAVEA
ncbi:MAG: hypothetical protein JWQ32_1889 [Marmoricola sp.]|nr:hypothetical protein [Marmoricola sp.]